MVPVCLIRCFSYIRCKLLVLSVSGKPACHHKILRRALFSLIKTPIPRKVFPAGTYRMIKRDEIDLEG